MQGGTAHDYEIVCCVLGTPSEIYIGGREGGAAKGGAQVGGILLGVPPRPRTPFPYLECGERQGRVPSLSFLP